MKNKVFAMLTVLVLCLSMIIPVSAASTHIFDDTDMIGQLPSLEEMAQNIEDTYGFSVLLTVVETTNGKQTGEYAYEIYEANATEQHGLVLIYDYGENRYNFYRAGKAENLFTNEILTEQVWAAFANTETYYEGAVGYYNVVENILKENNVTADTTQTDTTQTDTTQADTEAQAQTEETTKAAEEERTVPLVVDNADILTDEQEADFTQKLETLGGKYELEAALLTVDSYEGKSDTEYADDYFIEKGYGLGENKDGFLIVYNTGKEDGTRNIYLCTHGSAIEYITDFERDVIFEMVIPYLEKGEYVQAFDTFISEADSATDPSTPVYYIPVSILIGFAIAFLIMKIQASKLKTVRPKVNAADYVGNVQLTYQSDNFMYMDVSKIKKSNNSSSSGGSSTHKSSSGDTFGGGGRNF